MLKAGIFNNIVEKSFTDERLRDRSGNTFVRNEQKIVTNSPNKR